MEDWGRLVLAGIVKLPPFILMIMGLVGLLRGEDLNGGLQLIVIGVLLHNMYYTCMFEYELMDVLRLIGQIVLIVVALAFRYMNLERIVVILSVSIVLERLSFLDYLDLFKIYYWEFRDYVIYPIKKKFTKSTE